MQVSAHVMTISIILPGGMRAHYDWLRARAFKTPATFHILAKSHWTVQWFFQANQHDHKTSSSPLFINIDVTISIHDFRITG